MVTASMVSAKKGYTPAFDLLNIAACISVVILHVNGAIWDFSYGRYWVTSLILECAFYWAVPVFFMLSGATLVDYRERYNTKAFFIHRFSKTLPPFLFWSVVSVFWAVYAQHSLPVDMLTDWRAWIDIIFNTKAMSIYWFFIPLFALYLCIPFISSVPETTRIKVFGFAFLYSFISGSCLPLLFQLAGIPYNAAINSPINGGGYVIFVLLGYLLTHIRFTKMQAIAIYALGIFGLLLRYIGTLVKSYKLGSIDNTFYGYSNFPSVVLAVAVFLWFWRRDWSFFANGHRKNALRNLSSASFGVYLVHMYFLRFFVDTYSINMRSWQWRSLGVAVVYAVSLVFVLILKQIPYLKRIVP